MAHSPATVSAHDSALAPVQVCRVRDSGPCVEPDVLAIEEPLEIRLGCAINGKPVRRGISITMRTPGHDEELAAGFLFTEGIIDTPAQIAKVSLCGAGDAVCIDLQASVTVDLARLERHFYAASSCGVCGKASLAAVHVQPRHRPQHGWPLIEATVIQRLPGLLRAAQVLFERTGGLHAAALFDGQGEGRLLGLREDVGRHNALDKLIGSAFLDDRVPLADNVLLVSGRVSFELVQKAAVAGIPILAAVGAPSSLAIELAATHGMTVIGFVRHDRFNIYTHPERVRQAALLPTRQRLLPLPLARV